MLALLDPVWIGVEDAVLFNRIAVEKTGETHFLRDQGLLEGALARVQNLFFYEGGDAADLCVRLMLGVAAAHPFEQGNKRTGFLCGVVFLNLNGLHLDVPNSREVGLLFKADLEEHVEHRMLALARRSIVVRA